MSQQIGFVFDHNTPQNYNSYQSQPPGYPQYPQPQQGYNSTFPNDYGQMAPQLPLGHQGTLVPYQPYQPEYPTYPNPDGYQFYGDQAHEVKGGYAPPQHYGTYDGSTPGHVMTPAEIESDVYGQHGRGGGIPGGKLGVIGGAAAAGLGTGLAMQLLPKKMKKNKLVKYGLPIAGAGVAGYALNQMNNGGRR